MKPLDKMAAAKLRILDRAPYVSAMLYALVPRETDKIPTMGVTRNAVMYWNPDFVNRLTTSQLAGVLYHEVWHLLRDHDGRRRTAGISKERHTTWNVAADAEINDDLLEDWDLPEMGDAPITPAKIQAPAGLSAEEYYRHLLENVDEAQVTKLVIEAGCGMCGGCSGAPGEGEDEDENAQGAGGGDGDDDQDAQGGAVGRGEAELDSIRGEVAAAVQDTQERGRGTVPAGMARWAADHVAPPKVHWQTKLARATRRAVTFRTGAVDYHYGRPSRRQSAVGFGRGRPVLPGMHRPLPRVAVAIDTSGSMGPDDLHEAVSELDGILRTAGAEVTFLACDAEVHAARQVRTWRDAVANLKGGGGTSFVPVFEAVERLRPRPEVLVFATDGMGNAPAAPPPGLHTIWLIVGGHHVPFTRGGKSVDWGDLIFMEDA